jgi:hypothetical protein
MSPSVRVFLKKLVCEHRPNLIHLWQLRQLYGILLRAAGLLLHEAEIPIHLPAALLRPCFAQGWQTCSSQGM